VSTRYPLWYRIVLRGEIRTLLDGVDGNLHVESAQGGRTSIVASFRDEPEFWGLLQWLQGLALHVVSLHELDPRDAMDGPSAGAEGAVWPRLPAYGYTAGPGSSGIGPPI
jgi:hypothetical protein